MGEGDRYEVDLSFEFLRIFHGLLGIKGVFECPLDDLDLVYTSLHGRSVRVEAISNISLMNSIPCSPLSLEVC